MDGENKGKTLLELMIWGYHDLRKHSSNLIQINYKNEQC